MNRFDDDAPLDIDGDVVSYAEPIPFEPWPDGEPGLLGKLGGVLLVRPWFRYARWKRDHDRCYRLFCWRRRYRAPGAKGSHGACIRHDTALTERERRAAR